MKTISKEFANKPNLLRVAEEIAKFGPCAHDVAESLLAMLKQKYGRDHCKGTVERWVNDSLGRRQDALK